MYVVRNVSDAAIPDMHQSADEGATSSASVRGSRRVKVET